MASVTSNRRPLAKNSSDADCCLAGRPWGIRTFGRPLGRLLLLLGFVLLAEFRRDAGAQEVKAEPAKRVYRQAVLIRLDGPITSLLEHSLYRKLETAQSRGADLLILEIDSPGGALDATLNMADRLVREVDLRTVAYVPREALSGAAIISAACDEIWMGPSARLGDAGPIFLDEDFLFKHAPEKIRSDLAARVRELARLKHRPPALLEAMVDMNLVVTPMVHRETGERRFLSEAEIASLPEVEKWTREPPVFESREGHFLTVSGARAVELQLAKGTVEDRADLLRQFPHEGSLIELRRSWVDTAVFVLNSPWLTGLLFVVGLVALYVEFSSPGIGAGAAIAVFCFSLFFWSRFLGGTSTWLEVILFAVGVLFLFLEFFVVPGFGVTGVTGALLIVASLIMASQEFLVPRTTLQWETFGSSLLVVTGATSLVMVVVAVLSYHFQSIPLLNRLALQPPAPSVSDDLEPGVAGLLPRSEILPLGAPAVRVGDLGTTVSPLRPAGKIRVGDTFVDVVSEGDFIDRGSPVRVIQIHGNRIVVRQDETAV